ncbi:MAG: hypothetical protein JJ864_08635 [Rhizobiaceae bacterium]|nr:hypothetical protein [Rhizobiaceae bacterium]
MAKKPNPAKIVAYKGFNPDWTCNGFQYEVGKTFKHKGRAELCASGFHACQAPLDVFGYYPPTSKFALVEMSGVSADRRGDSKLCSTEITIKAELTLPDFIKRGVDYILSKVDFAGASETNTGDRSAATNTGDRSAATNTGYRSAATNTGDRSAATNTGDRSAATNTGYRSAATNTGKYGAAFATGIDGKVSGAVGCSLHLDERRENWGADNHGEILHAWAGIVGRDGIKPDTFYTLKDGQPVEVSDQ